MNTFVGRGLRCLRPFISGHFSSISDGSRVRGIAGQMPIGMEQIFSLATANQAEITRSKITDAITKFQSHEIDSGSPSVQIAVLTEKILNLARHFASHRKDYHSKRGFEMLISRRRRMMKYLKRTNVQRFKDTVVALGLQKEASYV
eukprot:gene1888-3660_t